MIDEPGAPEASGANRPTGNSAPNRSNLGAPHHRSADSSQISGCDAENKDEKTIYTQLLEVLSKLGILIDRTRPINTAVSHEEQGSRSEEWAKEIHTTLSSSRVDVRVWLDDISNMASSLPVAFEDLASRSTELEQTLQRIVHGMLQCLAAVDKIVVLDARGPSITAGHQRSDVLEPCNDFRGLVNSLQDLKKQVQTELGSITPDGSRQGEAIVNHPPSILCLDGGGVRSFVSLIILQNLMKYVHAALEGLENQLNTASASPVKPCDIFDFIFGSSSGGLLAIMLGRLEMTVEECFETFSAYAEEIFYHRIRFLGFLLPKYSDKRLVRAVRHIVGDFDPSPDREKWRGTIFKDTSGLCRTGVLAYIGTTRNSNSLGPSYTPYMIRSYDCEPEPKSEEESARFPALNPGPASSFQIWEAARATTAAPGYFPPLKHGDQKFYDGGITSNNPSLQALGEMQALLPHTPINCIVSIGTGAMPPLAAASHGAFRVLTSVLTETQNTERLAFATANGLEIPYFRFNPQLQRHFAIDEWISRGFSLQDTNKTLNNLRESVEKYLENVEVIAELRKCAEILAHRTAYGSKHILNWLTADDYAPLQSDLINQRLAGTGQWIIGSNEFEQWLQADKQTLFCPGGPGVGKTMLTSIVIDELMTRFGNNVTVGIAYVYCSFQRRQQQRAEDILASLLRQLAQGRPSLPNSVKLLYEKHSKQRTRPSLSDISRVLQSVVVSYSRVFIVIDAVDECYEADRTALLSEIFRIQKECRVTFFATSRFIIPELVEKPDSAIFLPIQANEEDVRRYIDSKMSSLPSFVRQNESLQQNIKTTIADAADGMLLLAYLYLNSLAGQKSPKTLQAALAKIQTGPGYAGPNVYDTIYESAMDRIGTQLGDQKALAIQALSWITCAKRPLDVTELRHALAVEVGEPRLDPENFSPIEDVLAVCNGLVTVDKESGIIRLVHYTVHEYFKRTRERWFPEAEAEIAMICATYLSFDVFKGGFCQTDEEFEKRLSENVLYNYAAHNWGHHARIASTLCQAVMDFLECETKVEASNQAMMAYKRGPWDTGYSQRTLRRTKGLHLAAIFGVKAAVQTLLEKSYELGVTDKYGRTPLSYAAEKGHVAVVELLLNNDRRPNPTDTYGRTPLSWAAAGGHEAIVDLLLAMGADPNSRDVSGRSPLSWAAIVGHEATAKLLLLRRADVGSRDIYERTPLSWAATGGHEAVVRLLFSAAADADCTDISGRTPVSWAAGRGHAAVISLLLNEGANANLGDLNRQTPLFWAAKLGHKVAVELLLDGGADISLNDTSGWTPLQWAAVGGYEAVVKLLVEKGANIKLKDSDSGQTLLLWEMHKIALELLRERSDKIESKNTDFDQITLWLAAASGEEAVVQLLLEKGVDIDTKDADFGQTPLLWAAEEGHEAVVRLLLQHGANINSRSSSGQTSLSKAAASGHEAIVKLLLEKGARVDLENGSGRTPLWWASLYGNTDIVELLQDSYPDLLYVL
ncbi:hypothetical protein F4825DRAFT_453150 [Nemania diffusa]|nr:hypothetical protein F4825DRAFT_453150 [Nemania diffusa]